MGYSTTGPNSGCLTAPSSMTPSRGKGDLPFSSGDTKQSPAEAGSMQIDALLITPESMVSLRVAIELDAALKHLCRLKTLSSWEELTDRALEGSFDLAFVDPQFPRTDETSESGFLELERVRSVTGPESLIPFLGSDARVLPTLGRMGFPFIIVRGVDDTPNSLLRVIARAKSRRSLRTYLLQAEGPVRVEDLEFLLLSITGWPVAQEVGDLARSMHSSVRTLRRRSSAFCLPSPGRLIRWGRLMDAQMLWQMGIRSKPRIASVLKMDSPSSVSRLSRELVNHRAEELFKPTGHSTLFGAFRRELAG